LSDAESAITHSSQFNSKVQIYVRLAKAHTLLLDWQAVLTICEKGVVIVEAHRYDVSGQYLQSSYLRSRIDLYSCAVQAAYKLQQYDLMLHYAELSKARSVLRMRSSAETKSEQELQTEKAFLEACEQIDLERVKGVVPDQLLMKRRVLWDLLLILRVRGKSGSEIPDFDPASVRALLDEDEAILYYYWLDPGSLLIIVVDREQYTPVLSVVPSEQHKALKELATSLVSNLTNAVTNYLEVPSRVANFQDLLLPRSIQDSIKSKK
jgi:hypothetical protein